MIHHRRTKRRLRKLYRRSRRNCRGGATNKASKQRNDTLRRRTAIRRESQIKNSVNTLRRSIAERRTAAKEKRLIEKLESKSLPPAEHNEMIELIRQKSQTLTPRLSPKSSIGERRGKTHIKQNTRSKTRAQTRKEAIAKSKKEKRDLKLLRKRQEEARRRQEERNRMITNPWAKDNERRARGRTFSPRKPPTPSIATMMPLTPTPPPTPPPTP